MKEYVVVTGVLMKADKVIENGAKIKLSDEDAEYLVEDGIIAEIKQETPAKEDKAEDKKTETKKASK